MPENCISIEALEKLGGDFKVLGFLWVLRDILGGKNEGVIDLKELALSLGVSMQKIYGFIGLLEDSFIIETHSELDGRRIKILITPLARIPFTLALLFTFSLLKFLLYV